MSPKVGTPFSPQSLLIFYQHLFFLTVAYCDQKESTERTILLALRTPIEL